jgi:hypothetical protein
LSYVRTVRSGKAEDGAELESISFKVYEMSSHGKFENMKKSVSTG